MSYVRLSRRRRTKSLSTKSGGDTRERLLTVGERLFAEKGFSGVSIREIVHAAGVNVAAAHYHFGSKEALFEQVFGRCAAPFTQLTYQMLDAAKDWAGHEQYLEQIIKALIIPSVRRGPAKLRSGNHYGRLRAHVFVEDRAFARQLFKKTYGEIGRRAVEMLHHALPSLSEREVAWRFHMLLAALVFSSVPAGRVHTPFLPGAYDPQNPAEAVEFLVPLLATMFRAPCARSAGRGRDARPTHAATALHAAGD
ncbi:MAG: TetR family transcriptional regulator [Alphaproteobacteria bacterium]|nr:TetR family transcriptional regulator [Alphaproteobacteria bacterium]